MTSIGDENVVGKTKSIPPRLRDGGVGKKWDDRMLRDKQANDERRVAKRVDALAQERERSLRCSQEDYISEYKLERNVGNHEESSPKRDVTDGFRILGPGGVGGTIRFTRYSPSETQADTPWGKMTVSYAPSAGFEWSVQRAEAEPVEIRIVPERRIQLMMKPDHSIILRNRAAWRARVYRYDNGTDMAEIRTSWQGIFYDEGKLHWRIVLRGFSDIGEMAVLAPLALFVCYWKVYTGFRSKAGFWGKHFAYDEMF